MLGPALVLGGLVAFAAHAEAASTWLESYRAPTSCPSADRFREQVEIRLSGTLDALAQTRVAVAVSRVASEDGELLWRSVMTVGGHGEPGAKSEVADGSCAALVEAMALVVALHVDAVPRSEPVLALDEPTLSPRARPSTAADGGVSAETLRFGAGVLGGVRSALGPEPALGLGVGVTLEWAGSGVWAPRLELSALYLQTDPARLPGETAVRFEALLASSSLCPVRGLGSDAAWVRACLDLEAGQLTGHGSGRALVRSEQRSAPWLASGASLRAGLSPFGRPLQLGAALGASFPLFRHEFYFAPNIEGFRVPSAGWAGSAQAAWMF